MDMLVRPVPRIDTTLELRQPRLFRALWVPLTMVWGFGYAGIQHFVPGGWKIPVLVVVVSVYLPLSIRLQRHHTWERSATELLAKQAWRWYEVRTVRRRWTGAEVDVVGVGVVRLHGVTRAGLMVVARHRGLWLIGPRDGALAARVPNSRLAVPAWPARGVVPAPDGVEVIRRGAAESVWALRGRLRFRAAALVARAARLADSVTWNSYPARFDDVHVDRSGFGPAVLVVTLPDGRELTGRVEIVDVETVRMVGEVGRIECADLPAPGRALAAGFPGYPGVALVVFP